MTTRADREDSTIGMTAGASGDTDELVALEASERELEVIVMVTAMVTQGPASRVAD